MPQRTGEKTGVGKAGGNDSRTEAREGKGGGSERGEGGEEEGGKVELGERGLGSRWVELMLELEGGMRGWMTLGQPNIRGGLIDKEMALFQIFGYFHQIIFL